MTLIILAVIGFLILLFIQSKPNLGRLDTLSKPYLSKSPLTPTEVSFYRRLVEALPEYVVLAQVQLASFIKVDRTKVNWNETHKWQNSISQQSVDYLICRKDFSIVTAIELDDKSHTGNDAIKRDNKKTDNLAAANIPLIRWHAEQMPSIEMIRSSIYPSKTDTSVNGLSWDDEIPSFMKVKNEKKNLKLLFPAILIIGFIWFAHQAYDGFTKKVLNVANIPITAAPKINSDIKIPTPSKSEVYFHGYESQLMPHPKIQEEENRRKALIAAQESDLKEEIWNRDFRNKVECTNTKSIVSCGNDYIRNRDKFEKYWEANKSRYIGTN